MNLTFTKSILIETSAPGKDKKLYYFKFFYFKYYFKYLLDETALTWAQFF